MTRRDWSSRSEEQAAASARADAYPDVQDERAEPSEPIDTGHDCTTAPFADTCVSCLVWERYWIRERAAVNQANSEEWFA